MIHSFLLIGQSNMSERGYINEEESKKTTKEKQILAFFVSL